MVLHEGGLSCQLFGKCRERRLNAMGVLDDFFPQKLGHTLI